SCDVNLYRESEIGEGFVYVPGGVFARGGDADAVDSLPRLDVELPDYAIAKFPVTFREYCAYLDALDARGERDLAERRAPHDAKGGPDGMLAQRGDGGRW